MIQNLIHFFVLTDEVGQNLRFNFHIAQASVGFFKIRILCYETVNNFGSVTGTGNRMVSYKSVIFAKLAVSGHILKNLLSHFQSIPNFYAIRKEVPYLAISCISDSVVQGITKGTEEVWKLLIGIVAPIAAVALALQVIKIIWGGQRAAEEAKSAAIKIVVAIAVVLMAPAIISAVRGWFQQASWSFG